MNWIKMKGGTFFGLVLLASCSSLVGHIKYHKKCVEGKEDAACVKIATIELKEGNKKNAFFYFQKSCRIGNYNSCANAGITIWLLGSPDLAEDYLLESCHEGKDLRGCFYAGSWNLEKNNFERAAFYFKSLCKQKYQNSCEELKNTDLKEKEFKQAVAQKEAYDEEVAICKNGNKKACWGLYVANKDNQYGYEHLRDACLLGHRQACDTKRVLDEETNARELRNQQIRTLAEQERRNTVYRKNQEREALWRKSACLRDAAMGAGSGQEICNPNCDGYEECLERKRIQNERNKKIRCKTNGYGGYLTTECEELKGYEY